MDHDQNFKNLILDYPREALALFAGRHAAEVDAQARITPLRQEQLKARLGDRFRALDVPLQVEWPDGRREAILFVLEEETEPRHFDIHRLAHYCLDLSVMLGTQRVVPVVIFLRPGGFARQLALGTTADVFLRFKFVAQVLPELKAVDYLASRNVVARLNLPNMAHARSERIEVYAAATRGLFELEQDPQQQLKYLDFIDMYAALDENEQRIYRQRFPEESREMTRFAERFIGQGIRQGIEKGIEQGIEQGLARGRRHGEAAMLLRFMAMRFGEVPDAVRERVLAQDEATLLRWSERVLSAERLEQIFD